MKYFIAIAKREVFLLLFLAIAFISQVIFGYHLNDSIFLGIGYAFGSFAFVSIAYSIIYHNSGEQKPRLVFDRSGLQLGIVGLLVVLYFLVLSGQFPQSNILNEVSSPFRIFLYRIIGKLGYSPVQVSMLIHNLIAVVIPLLLLLIFARNTKWFSSGKMNYRILLYLFLLYLPVIVLRQLSISEIVMQLPAYLLIAVIPEEFLFRGFLQARLESFVKNPVNALLIASIVFGLIHLPFNTKMYGDFVGMATCFGNNAFGGLLYGYLFYKTRSLGTVIAFHLVSGIAFGT